MNTKVTTHSERQQRGDVEARAAATASVPDAPPHPAHTGMALVVLLVGAFLAPLDYFIVNLALPSIHAGVAASDAQLQLIISAYASAFAVLLITGGRLGDLFGRKRIFMAGMAGFVIASALCGVATSGTMLVGARILQGMAAALMVPQVLATIRAVVPLHQQTKVIGFYGFVYGLSSIVGQLGGGALITYRPFGLDWRAVFLINVPIGVLAFAGAWKYIPENRQPDRTKVDVIGVVLLSLLLLMLIYPLTHGREAGWPLWTFVMFGLSVPVFAVFIAVEQRIVRGGGFPLVDLQLFRNPAFSIGLVVAFLFYCNSAFFLTYGIYLQTGLHWTPLQAGLAIMPFAVGFVFGPLTSPAVVARIGTHVLTLGFALLAAGFTVTGWAALRHTEPGLLFYAGLVGAGVGHGLVFPSVMRVVLSEVAPEKAGLASGVVNTTLQIGAAFGIAAISGVFFGILQGHDTPQGYARAFEGSLSINAMLLAGCVVLSVMLVRYQQRALRQIRENRALKKCA
ncbi:MFS transporter [Paraburkholderia rhizosphaerae]|uniref:EmrB/QacA subfamily drug resistance transporter n=1 Tax=Paraburkholderia rhizosphaerae TaxID=480658 RepID=A0A4R8L534_9BURK|nr:MFS transporter [Paraburkholderia rhizosphaerae]TDY37079.1 EmrB/QacA subfamily drug resistance transporter [Paraburkholderia rhizosphaerae]